MLNFSRACLVLAALPALAFCADLAFEIPPLLVSIDIAGQPVAITLSGNISGAPSGPTLALNLSADLSDFQNHLTPLLQTELNQSNRCGERISIDNATLVPAAPAGHLTVHLHFEKWVCFKALGRENARKLLAGEGTVQVLLTPQVDEANSVHLDANITGIDADGPVGDILRSEPLGTALRDKIRDAMLKAIRRATDLQTVVPAQAQPFVTLQSAAFSGLGGGRIALDLNGRLRLPREQAAAILDQFRNRRADPR